MSGARGGDAVSAEAVGVDREKSTAADAQDAAMCQCGHAENVHVPFPACGDLGWYGCVQCTPLGTGATERCRFFRAVSQR